MIVRWWRPLWLSWSVTSLSGNLFQPRAGQFLPWRVCPGVATAGGVSSSFPSSSMAWLRRSSFLPAGGLPRLLAGQLHPCRAGPSPPAVGWAGLSPFSPPSFRRCYLPLRSEGRFPFSRAGQHFSCLVGPLVLVTVGAGPVCLLLPLFLRQAARLSVSRRCPGRLVAYAR